MSRTNRNHRMATALVLAPILVACAGGGTAGDVRPATAGEFEALYRERIEAARGQFTEADIRFVTGMIGHHAQALVMAGLAPERSSDPAIRTLAARIESGQEAEIATMQQWFGNRDLAVPHVEIDGLESHVHGGSEHGDAMPGMLTTGQLQELAASRGPDFDRLFLSLMIEHHEGAVTMVEELFRTDGAGQDEDVFRLASDIQVDQRTEIARMQRMLDAFLAGND